MDDINVKVARLEERVGNILVAVSDIQLDQKTQSGKLDQLLAVDNQRRGAAKFAKALMGIGSGSGAIALLAWVAEHFRP